MIRVKFKDGSEVVYETANGAEVTEGNLLILDATQEELVAQLSMDDVSEYQTISENELGGLNANVAE